MKKFGILGMIIMMLIMLTGCGSTTYTLKFDDLKTVVVLNKNTNTEVNLSKEQITTVTKELGEVTFADEEKELGEGYLYQVSMSNDVDPPVDLYIYDATHMKINDKYYIATKNEMNLQFYQSLFE